MQNLLLYGSSVQAGARANHPTQILVEAQLARHLDSIDTLSVPHGERSLFPQSHG